MQSLIHFYMIMVARNREYPVLLEELKGKRVLVWTCNTCARLCDNIGGTESCEKLIEQLEKDGVEVVGLLSTSASCMEKKVRSKEDKEILDKCDIVLSMTCDMGALCASRVFHKKVICPLDTVGTGFIDEHGSLKVCCNTDGKIIISEVSKEAEKKGLISKPFL